MEADVTKYYFMLFNFHVYVEYLIWYNWEVNPLTPMSDQDRISPYNINTISTRQVMRIKKNINLGVIS